MGMDGYGILLKVAISLMKRIKLLVVCQCIKNEFGFEDFRNEYMYCV